MITTPVKLWRRGKNLSLQVGKKGKVVQWTMIRIPPKAFMDQTPYPVVIVKLENNENMIGQMVDWEEKHLKSGQKVVAVIRKIIHDQDTSTVIHYGIKFRPA